MAKSKTKSKKKSSTRSASRSGSKSTSKTKSSPAKSRTTAAKRSAKKVKKATDTKVSRRTAASAKSAKPREKGIKTYAAALDFLASQVNYERRPPRRRDRGQKTLDRITRLLKDLGDPQNTFKAVHIAGTKGKGSTAAMLTEMLANNGLKTGTYTSPHVMDVRERIALNGEPIPKARFTAMIAKIAEVSKSYGDQKPTYFEILTAAAMLWFAEEKVDITVFETGLGGRFDATSLVNPLVCAITAISLDHMAQLGDTLDKIATEKAGIFKEGVPIISAPQEDVVKKVLKDAAEARSAEIKFAGEDIRYSYRFEASREAGPQARICVTTPTCHFDHLLVPLVGEHQAINCGVAIGVIDELRKQGVPIEDEKCVSGLRNVSLPGRMEMICEEPRVLGDGAHNAASIEALMRAIGQNVPYDSMVVIFGCCADKDVEGMLKLIQLGADKIIFTKINSPRAMDPTDLAVKFSEVAGRMAQVATSLEDAFVIAEKAVTREDLICVTGSFYLVSEAKVLFADHPHRSMSTLVQTA